MPASTTSCRRCCPIAAPQACTLGRLLRLVPAAAALGTHPTLLLLLLLGGRMSLLVLGMM